MRPVRAPMRQRGALPRQENWRPSRRFHEVRELPALHASVPHPGSRHHPVAPGGRRKRRVDRERHGRHHRPGPDRRRFARFHGQPEELPHLLGASAAEREPGDEPLHRSSARAHGNPRGAGQPPEQAARERAHPHRCLAAAAAAVAGRAHHVLGHELRFGVAQHPEGTGDGRARAGHLLQLRRGRPAPRLGALRRPRHRAGGQRALRRGPALPERRRGHRDQDGQGAKPGIGGHLPARRSTRKCRAPA